MRLRGEVVGVGRLFRSFRCGFYGVLVVLRVTCTWLERDLDDKALGA